MPALAIHDTLAAVILARKPLISISWMLALADQAELVAEI